MNKHRIHKLFEERLAQSTKPFRARGADLKRCGLCRIDVKHCVCNIRPTATTNAGFLLLYYDDEILKPSNTGKLIADLFDDTFGFIWKRTEVSNDLLTLLNDDTWQPMIVFPSEYVQENRTVYENECVVSEGKRPLFILFDGSWREAKKMFRKSPYLDEFPVVSISADRLSQYQVRKATRDHQLATAEVVSFVLETIGELKNAELLRTWFDVFSFRYQRGVKQENRGDASAESRLAKLVAQKSINFD